MSLYDNANPSSAVTSVEFSDLPGGNMAFFRMSGAEGKEEFKRKLTESGQEILAETDIAGKPVLVTQGSQSKEELLNVLAAAGEKFAPHTEKSKFNPWAWRGGLSVVGQTLQILSAKFSSKGLDAAVFGFAVPNLIANGINFIFGGQKSPDKHHMVAFKDIINKQLATYVPDQSALPDPDSKSKAIGQEKKGVGDILTSFIRRSSVSFGEIGLRLLGSISLAFPYTKWKETLQLLGRGKLKQAFMTGKNPDAGTFWVGVTMLVGKFMGFGAKVSDPFDPKKHTLLDTIREKYVFKGSSVVEGGAAAYMAYDRLKNKKIILNKGTPHAKEVPDYFGFAGNAVFDVGYAIRYTAPFGTKELDMPELYAHTAKALSLVPQENMPQAVAKASATIVEHLGEKAPSFESVYRNIAGELYRDYLIAIPKKDNVTAPVQAEAENGSHVRKLDRPRFSSAEEMVREARAAAGPSQI